MATCVVDGSRVSSSRQVPLSASWLFSRCVDDGSRVSSSRQREANSWDDTKMGGSWLAKVPWVSERRLTGIAWTMDPTNIRATYGTHARHYFWRDWRRLVKRGGRSLGGP